MEFQGRFPGGHKFQVLRQYHRQIGVGHGDNAAGGAGHHGDGAAPIALAANQPIAQAIGDGSFAQPLRLQPTSDGGASLGFRGEIGGQAVLGGQFRGPIGQVVFGDGRQAAEGAAVDHHPRRGEGFGEGPAIPIGRSDHHRDGQVIFLGKGKVALIAAGDGHDRAGAVGHQHVIGNPDGDALLIDRVDGVSAGEDAGFFLFGGEAVDFRLAGGLLDVGGDGGPLLRGGQLIDQRVFRGHDHEGRPPQGIGPGGEDGQFMLADFGAEDHFAPSLRPIQFFCMAWTRSGQLRRE